MEIGESFVGTGPNAANVNTVLGPRDGPVGAAWATALASPTTGHAPFLAVIQPGLPVKPFTLFVNRSRIEGAGHARLTFGAAHAGVAAGVADAVAAGVVPEDEADQLVLIAAVWVDAAADDADVVYANNREATRSAIVIGRAGLPVARDAVAKRGEVWNPYYRPAPPPPEPEPEPEPPKPKA
jgi:5,6,7,8-tetrahydromethanopterin hydro-lyase